MRRPNDQRLRMWIAVLFLGALTVATADEGTKTRLVVCAVPDAMPQTGRTKDGLPHGLAAAVAHLVAKELGRELEFHWCASAACSWNCVRDKRCDVVIGQPHGGGPVRELAWSVPYAGSRFGLVVPQGEKSIRSAADLKGKRVGVVAGTAAAKEWTAVPFKARAELLDKFAESKLDAAFVDDDFAAWHLHAHPELALARVAEYVPRERWNMSFAVRAAETALLKDIDRALNKVLQNGDVSRAFAEFGISYRAPFAAEETKPKVADSWKRISETGELVVSMDPANLPYSANDAEHPGLDVELARALAEKLGVKLRVEWIDIHRETAIGELLDGDCDLAFGSAIEPGAVDDEVEIASKVIYSRPYYGTGYVLVTRKDGPTAKSLTELKGAKSRRIGTEAGSVADYHLRQRGYLRRLFRTQLSVLKALHDGGIDYGYLWANVGWIVHASPEINVELVRDYVPEDHWNIAVAMRRGDDELKRRVDQALETLVADGVVTRILERYHVPAFSPFGAELAKPPAGEPKDGAQSGIIRRPSLDRGPAPQMERRQRSKERYSSLSRIRSTGVLTVGLDQNSLPFSTAHPEPSGLEYEIAGLLAEKLGVSLKVYWAYSSHDSYPSKLANKELCDVILGATPDDRFGQRVAYSQPYYFADYRFVVSSSPPEDGAASSSRPPEGGATSSSPPSQGGAGGGSDAAPSSPFAVERGLALRGIRDLPVHEYPSLAEILEAVTEGREAAGYVISTRGAWLAAERWPGKLKLVKAESSGMDRFPICAAVRKNDADLREVVDRAFAELAQSDKLPEVFARWHIPYEPTTIEK